MYGLIDTHAHLDEFEDPGGIIARAREAGVAAVVAVGSDLASNKKVLELATLYPDFVYPALGWHPWNINQGGILENLDFIEKNINRAVAVGEVGLDYHRQVRAKAEKALQQHVLREIMGIARMYGRPVLIHSRYAWQDALDIARDAGLTKAVFHWYTGTSSVLSQIIACGYYLSVTPAVAYHEEHRRAVKEAPLAQLLLETDSPVVYARGREGEFRATPADVLRSLRGAAVLKGLSEAEVAAVTTQNARNFFGR